ncbi:hypothetical protein AB7310_15885 [Cylindrospermopsis raciborskii UAM/DH-BiRr]
MTLYLGIDFGTSGARGIVIDEDSTIRGEIRLLCHPDWGDAVVWRATLWELLGAISQDFRRQIRGIAINGTSSTVLLTNAIGEPVCLVLKLLSRTRIEDARYGIYSHLNDPMLAPRLDPRPEGPREFLHGLLQGMARIEQKGYNLLEQLGADKLIHVYTAGGGAVNSTWTTMRKRFLKTNVTPSTHTEAAYGTALLAMGLPIDHQLTN